MVCQIHTVDFIILYFHIESSSICLLVGSDNCNKNYVKFLVKYFQFVIKVEAKNTGYLLNYC